MKKRTEKRLRNLAVWIFIIEVVICSAFIAVGITREEPLVPHEMLNYKENPWLDMAIFVIEVPLVGERHASDQELDAIADHLLGSSPPERSWVFFYLPGVVPDDWEYVTPHYLPERDGVVIVPFSHYRTGYEYWGDTW